MAPRHANRHRVDAKVFNVNLCFFLLNHIISIMYKNKIICCTCAFKKNIKKCLNNASLKNCRARAEMNIAD